MDTEQLRLLLDAFTQLGEGGKEAFIWWLAVTQGVSIATTAIVWGSICWACVKVSFSLTGLAKGEILLCYAQERLKTHDGLGGHEFDPTIAKLRQLIEDEANKR